MTIPSHEAVMLPMLGAVADAKLHRLADIRNQLAAEFHLVRHAYFCGGNEPYESLKRALRADIDEEAWSSLYWTTSRPFPTPKTGRIAVKVINHYGNEVMKVLEVGP